MSNFEKDETLPSHLAPAWKRLKDVSYSFIKNPRYHKF